MSNYAREIKTYSQNAVFSTVELKTVVYTGRIADEYDSDLRYSEVPLKGKNKTLVKILGNRQQRTTPAGQILGGGSRPLQPLRR